MPPSLGVQTGRVTYLEMADPRDPRGLRGDAPLLDAWLRFTERAEAGEIAPMSVPGHKQRRDLVGPVVAGDAPLYGGLDTIKPAGVLRAEGEARAARVWGAVLGQLSVARSSDRDHALALAVGSPGHQLLTQPILLP